MVSEGLNSPKRYNTTTVCDRRDIIPQLYVVAMSKVIFIFVPNVIFFEVFIFQAFFIFWAVFIFGASSFWCHLYFWDHLHFLGRLLKLSVFIEQRATAPENWEISARSLLVPIWGDNTDKYTKTRLKSKVFSLERLWTLTKLNKNKT